jgi:hypothetical protein
MADQFYSSTWANPYRMTGYNSRMIPRNYTSMAYGSDEYQAAMRELYGDMTGTDSTESGQAWDEFARYLTNASLQYMTGEDAAYQANQLGAAEGWYDGTDLTGWSNTSNGAGGRSLDNWFDSGARWDAINLGLQEALNYLWGSTPQQEGGESKDVYENSMDWLYDVIALGQKYGLRRPDQVRTRSQTADMEESWQDLINSAEGRGVNSNVKKLGEQLWGFSRETSPTSQLGFNTSQRYQWTPSGSGNGAFYSYRNTRYT